MSEKNPHDDGTDIDDATATGGDVDDVETTEQDGTPVENPSG
ncbi:hypothetical protein DEU34_3163 [Microbacterium sp. AG1240]|nr:hypothetical protein [Microbacterium sp. AG1240]RKT31224.1 hypothetical protein DEU34_3163 [Microbacterium sp. AG1240]